MKKLHILFSVILVLYGAVYVNYNLSVFQQLFAHYFYVETEVKKVTRNYSCMNVNISAPLPSVLNRNESILLGGSLGPREYHFEHDGKEYTGNIKSYIERFFRCRYVISKIYFFPLFPKWSIVENRIPDRVYMNNFFISSTKFLAVSLLYVLFLIFKKRNENYT